MTPEAMIDELDAMMPNSYGPMDKLRWLNELDGRVIHEILSAHTPNAGETVPESAEYTDENMDSVELLIPEPYTEVYFYWLQSKIHYRNQEFNYYQNTYAMFNQAWQDFANFHRRTHTPIAVARKWF